MQESEIAAQRLQSLSSMTARDYLMLLTETTNFNDVIIEAMAADMSTAEYLQAAYVAKLGKARNDYTRRYMVQAHRSFHSAALELL